MNNADILETIESLTLRTLDIMFVKSDTDENVFFKPRTGKQIEDMVKTVKAMLEDKLIAKINKES